MLALGRWNWTKKSLIFLCHIGKYHKHIIRISCLKDQAKQQKNKITVTCILLLGPKAIYLVFDIAQLILDQLGRSSTQTYCAFGKMKSVISSHLNAILLPCWYQAVNTISTADNGAMLSARLLSKTEDENGIWTDRPCARCRTEFAALEVFGRAMQLHRQIQELLKNLATVMNARSNNLHKNATPYSSKVSFRNISIDAEIKHTQLRLKG